VSYIASRNRHKNNKISPNQASLRDVTDGAEACPEGKRSKVKA